MSKKKVFIISGKRTPFGKFGGSLRKVSPTDLAVHCSREMLSEISLSPKKIDHVILGNVIPSSSDTLYGGRHLALKIGCLETTPGYTVNRLCGSGIQAISDAARLIRLGEGDLILAAGTENMSMSPHMIYGGRFGQKYGSLKNVDILLESLTDQYAQISMGETAEKVAEVYSITREECDLYALDSHRKALRGYTDGHFAKEIVPMTIRKQKVDRDEHMREKITMEDLLKLRSSFKKEGVLTAGSSSGIVDGAVSLLVASEAFCRDHDLIPIAEVIDDCVVGVDPSMMGIGPVAAITNLLERCELSIDQIDLFEINEAFTSQVIACYKTLKIDMDKLNVYGGAIAIGHPLAASGARITLTLANLLKRRDLHYGIASACIGGGQGTALLLKNIKEF